MPSVSDSDSVKQFVDDWAVEQALNPPAKPKPIEFDDGEDDPDGSVIPKFHFPTVG